MITIKTLMIFLKTMIELKKNKKIKFKTKIKLMMKNKIKLKTNHLFILITIMKMTPMIFLMVLIPSN